MSTEKPGVYAIVHTATARMYVGSTANLSKRWSRHRQELTDGIHRNRHLQAAWNKYGPEAFEWRILELCAAEDRIAREQHYIDAHDLTDPSKGFNKAATAGVSYGGLGRRWTDEQRRAASAYWRARRPAGWIPPARQEAEGRETVDRCPQGHVKDGSYVKRTRTGGVKVRCQECEREDARERARRKAAKKRAARVAEPWPDAPEEVTRHELTDQQWAAVVTVLPPMPPRGLPRKDDRRTVEAIRWVLRNGARRRTWEAMPARYGPWSSTYRHYLRWTKDGTWARIEGAFSPTEGGDAHVSQHTRRE